jgi:hypothetical protein
MPTTTSIASPSSSVCTSTTLAPSTDASRAHTLLLRIPAPVALGLDNASVTDSGDVRLLRQRIRPTDAAGEPVFALLMLAAYQPQPKPVILAAEVPMRGRGQNLVGLEPRVRACVIGGLVLSLLSTSCGRGSASPDSSASMEPAYPPGASAASPAERVTAPHDLALDRAVLAARMADSGPEYAFARQGDGLTAVHPQSHVLLGATNRGVEFRPAATSPAWRFRLRTRAIGRDGVLRALPEVAPRGERNRIEYDYGTIREFYLHGQPGVEHGMTLPVRPPGAGPLVVEVNLDGLHAIADGPDGLALVDGTNQGQASITGLYATDSQNRDLEAHLEATATGFRYVITDADARYPVRVDPLVWIREATLVASDSVSGDQFGFSVAIDGDTALVGAASDRSTSGLSAAGSAYVFVRSGSTWTQQAKLTLPGARARDQFGWSVALSGNTAVVGAFGRDLAVSTTTPITDAGAVAVFVRSGSTWTFQAELPFIGATAGAYFGWSVAISGNTAAVGIPYNRASGGTTGSITGQVHTFLRTGTSWGFHGVIFSITSAGGDEFGSSVAMDGNSVLVGAPGANTTGGVAAGRACTFSYNAGSWSEEACVVAPDGVANDAFGYAVALSGTTAVVGARTANTDGLDNVGSAYVLVRAGTAWPIQAQLASSDRAAGDLFGSGVAVDGDRVVVDSPWHSLPGLPSGSAYIFHRSGSTWTQEARVDPTTARFGSSNGKAVGISGDTVLIGGPDSEKAFVYVLRAGLGDPCTAAATCASNYCVDGVCCNNACGAGSTSDCQACSVTSGGTMDGTCGALNVATAPTVTCRPSAGGCDVADVCAPTSTSCPADVVVAAGAECRAALGLCDVPETCTGTSAACPTDGLVASGTMCRVAVGPCDVAETCSGSSAACPSDLLVAATVVCRSSAGACDVAERCSGLNPDCPTDQVATAGTTCRLVAGICDTAEACNGVASACPTDGFVSAATECRPSVGTCDVAERCTGSGALCPSNGFATAATPCRGSTGPCDVAETCTGAGASCPGDALASASTECRPAAGPCDPAERCSGTTTTCPTDQLAGAATVCRGAAGVCDLAETCTGTSPSCPPNAFAGTSTECRAAVGVCDVPESCDGAGAACPADQFASTTTECRPAIGPCDLAERCTGSTAACPGNAFASTATECRPAAGACDVAEVCTGVGASCPGDALASASTECRPSAGPCDPPEQCSGTTITCPTDTLAAAATVCRAAAGSCDLAEACTGASPSCPSNSFAGTSMECRPAAGPCDVAESCDGASAACPGDEFATTATNCRPAMGICDVAEHCTGAGAACPSNAFASSATECRPATGVCDVAENCTGIGASCPSNGVASSSIECRPAVGSCDASEYCDGASTSCPLDLPAAEGTTCSTGPACVAAETCAAGVCGGGGVRDCDDGNACTADACAEPSGCTHTAIPGCADAGLQDGGEADAGADDGGTTALDAGADGDAGGGDSGAFDAATADDAGAVAPPERGGCGCSAPGSQSRVPALLVTIFGLLIFSARRGRRRAPPS